MTKTKKSKKASVETQADRKKAYKKRAKAALGKMPFAWINFFIKIYPEYTEKKVYVTNVARGFSYDEVLTEKLEAFVQILEP